MHSNLWLKPFRHDRSFELAYKRKGCDTELTLVNVSCPDCVDEGHEHHGEDSQVQAECLEALGRCKLKLQVMSTKSRATNA